MANFIPSGNGASLGNFFSYFASHEIIEVKICYRQRDGQADKSFDTIYGGVRIFLQVKFATSLLASLAGGQFRVTFTICIIL